IYLILFLLCTGSFISYGQIEGEVIKPRGGKFLLENATIVTVTKGTIQNGSVLISGGKIEAVGTDVSAADATVIDCSGLFIYPGMIDAGNQLGLVEVHSVAETQDFAEIGDLSPHMQALTAVNPNSVAIPVARVSGVTTSLALPSGGIFPRTAALIHLNGCSSEHMFAGFKGVVMNFPSSVRRGSYDRRTDEEIKKEAEKSLKQINEIWEKATVYQKLDAADAELNYYPEMAQMAKVVAGELPLLI